MKNFFKTFTLRLAILCFTIAIIAFSMFKFLLVDKNFETFPLQIVVLIVMTTFSHLRLAKASQYSIPRYYSVFVQLMALKLFVYLAYLGITMHFDRASALTIGISFMTLYFVFTAFEISQFTRFLKSNT